MKDKADKKQNYWLKQRDKVKYSHYLQDYSQITTDFQLPCQKVLVISSLMLETEEISNRNGIELLIEESLYQSQFYALGIPIIDIDEQDAKDLTEHNSLYQDKQLPVTLLIQNPKQNPKQQAISMNSVLKALEELISVIKASYNGISQPYNHLDFYQIFNCLHHDQEQDFQNQQNAKFKTIETQAFHQHLLYQQFQLIDADLYQKIENNVQTLKEKEQQIRVAQCPQILNRCGIIQKNIRNRKYSERFHQFQQLNKCYCIKEIRQKCPGEGQCLTLRKHPQIYNLLNGIDSSILQSKSGNERYEQQVYQNMYSKNVILNPELIPRNYIIVLSSQNYSFQNQQLVEVYTEIQEDLIISQNPIYRKTQLDILNDSMLKKKQKVVGKVSQSVEISELIHKLNENGNRKKIDYYQLENFKVKEEEQEDDLDNGNPTFPLDQK